MIGNNKTGDSLNTDVNWLNMDIYAKTLNVSRQAVRKAIDNGRIPANAVKITKSTGRGGQGINILINKTEADIAWVNTENTSQGNRSEEAKQRVGELRNELEAAGKITPGQVTVQETPKISLAEAQRIERAAKAKMAQLEVLKAEETLIRKEVVYKQLFDAGQQLREAIMAVPDRIVSEIVAAGGDHTVVRRIMTEALTSSLEGLSDIYTKKLG